MRTYVGVIALSFRDYQAYRTNMLLRVVTGLIGVMLQAVVWSAIYARRSVLGGFTMTEAVTYVIVSQALMRATVVRSGLELTKKFRSGEITKDLCLPVDLQAYLGAKDLGRSLSASLFVSVPMFLISWMAFRITVPASAGTWCVFLLAWLLGVVLQLLLGFLAGVAGIYTQYGWGTDKLKDAIVLFFSGAIVPLDFFPPGLERLARALPFQSAYYLPLSIYVGKTSLPQALPVLGLQAFWCVTLLLLSRVAWTIARRRLSLFGG